MQDILEERSSLKMKSASWLVLIILTFLKTSSAENSTLVYFVELQIEESALQNLTDLLTDQLTVTFEGSNAIVTNISIITECNSTNCKCYGNYIRSDKVCTNYPSCQLNNSCTPTCLDIYDLCISTTAVNINGTFTITSDVYNNKTWPILQTTDFITELEKSYSLIPWFKSVDITSLRKGSIIGDFVVQFDETINVTMLESQTKLLADELNATFNLVTTGLISISRNPNDTIKYNDQVNITCTPKLNISKVMWFIQSDVKKTQVTNGTESTVYQNKYSSTVIINNASEFWQGTLICDYFSSVANLTHRASIALDIALLPNIFITSEPQFPRLDKNKNITISCIIENSPEPYTFTPSDYSKERGNGTTNYTFYILWTDGICNVTCTFTNRKNQTTNASLNIITIGENDPVCNEESIWPEAKVNFFAKLLCPQSGLNIMTRKCNLNKTYEAVISDCVDKDLFDLWSNAKDIQRGIGSVTLEAFDVFSNLKQSTEKVQSFSSIDAFANIDKSVDIMHLMQNASREQNSLWNGSVLPNILTSSSNLLNETLLDKWTNKSLAIKYLVSLENILQQTNVTSTQSNCQEQNVQIIHTQLNSSQQCITNNISIRIKYNSSNILFQTVIRNLDQLLPDVNNWTSTGLIFSVIANNTGDQSISMTWETKRLRNYELMCVYFNTSANKWSNDVCTWDYNLNICTCKHLSAFTILMSKYPLTLLYLDQITNIGLAFSIGSLALCLLIEFLVWNTVVKSNISHFKHTVLVNIVLSLLIAHCCFLAGNPKEFKQWCLVLTVLKHYFFLAVFFWMMCFSMGLLHQLTFYFVQLRKKVYLWLCFSFGYACPLLIVIVTFITYNNGALDSYYVNETCWLKYESPLCGSIHFFIVPVGMIVLVNMFTMVVVISKLLKPTISEGTTHDEKEIVRGIIKTIVLLTPSLGTTWILGFFVLILDLTFKPYAQIINYAFVILNSFQGFFILLTGFLADKKVRNALLTHLKQKHVAVNRGEISTNITAAKKK